MSNDQTSLSLLHRVRTPSDREAWDRFVAIYTPIIRAYVASKLSNSAGVIRDVIDDVTQTTLATLVDRLPGFTLDHSIGRFRTWLWRVTMNVLIDHIRKERRQADIPKELADRVGGDAVPDEAWETVYRSKILSEAMRIVKEASEPRKWECFARTFLGGETSKEVGKELEMLPNTVRQNTVRILDRLREKCRELDIDFDE